MLCKTIVLNDKTKTKKTIFVHIMLFWTFTFRGIQWTISCHIIGQLMQEWGLLKKIYLYYMPIIFLQFRSLYDFTREFNQDWYFLNSAFKKESHENLLVLHDLLLMKIRCLRWTIMHTTVLGLCVLVSVRLWNFKDGGS